MQNRVGSILLLHGEPRCSAARDIHCRTRIISICSGVFVLAAAGLLRGKSATTHWRYTDYLAQHYPRGISATI
ncbi:hypothetical protein CBW58_12380 [Yersinia frederiksenii]|nr:hypothetical protein CBW58_12380 [Yersinia frederiksenii]